MQFRAVGNYEISL